MDTRGVIDVMLDNPNVDSFVREKELRIDELRRLIDQMVNERDEVRTALDAAEVAGGDAPHRALSLATRIQILAMRDSRDEEVLLRDACGLERAMHVAARTPRLRLPVARRATVKVGDALTVWVERVEPTFEVRDFDWRGRRDVQGRRILEEVVR